MVIARSFFAVVVGSVIAVALFYGMYALVAVSTVRLEEDGGRRAIEFVRLKRDSAEAKKKEARPQRQKAPPPPKTPPMKPQNNNNSGQALNVNIPMPAATHEVKLSGRLSAGTVRDREAVPVVRVNPIYPSGAAQRGIEGYATIKFTIGPSGNVTDAEVIGSDPPGVFDRAALKAIRRWRYDPKLVDGRPVARPNQRVTLTFELGK